MRIPISALWMILALAALLALPATASESETGGGTPPMAREVAPSQVPDIAEILPSVPEPLFMTGTVHCDQCGTGTSSPSYQCRQECRSMGYFVDTCEADATTCQLIGCYCMYW